MQLSNPRAAAVDALLRIEKGVMISDALDDVLNAYHLSGLDRGLAVEIVYGTVRMQKAIDYALNTISRIKTDTMEPRIRSILRAGAYQILYLSRVPVSAAVNEAVKLVPARDRRRTGDRKSVV